MRRSMCSSSCPGDPDARGILPTRTASARVDAMTEPTWPRCARSTPTPGCARPTSLPTRSRCSSAGSPRRSRRRAARAQRDGGRHRLRRRRARRRGWCCSRALASEGFVFFTNTGSRKGAELAATRAARCCSRGTRWSGRCGSRASRRRSRARTVAAYFAARPRGSQLGAWASPPVAGVAGRAELADGVRRGGGAVRRPRRAGARRVGRLPSSCPRRSSSGRAGPAGCTTGSSTGPPRRLARRAAGAVMAA